ncbi:MAG: peptidoglycan D,D-transpeptidase FtsI family protein [Planctomycetota bacterium]|jgi:cell division protein FtsI (penicillin-binding protein 3)
MSEESASDTSGVSPDRIGRWSRVAVAGVSLLLAGALIRVAQLQAAPEASLEAHLEPRTAKAVRPAMRGRLLDRRGQIIALSVPSKRLFADPRFVREQWVDGGIDPLGNLALRLASATGLDAGELTKRLRDRADSRYVVLADRLEPWQAEAASAIDVPGIGLEAGLVRHRPFGDLAAGLIGRVGWTGEDRDARPHAGQAGAEARFERDLRHEAGSIGFRRDARGRTLEVFEGGFTPPQDGTDVRLSIDMVVQAAAEQVLAEAVERSNAAGGQVIVVDLVDGGLLAVADLIRENVGRDGAASDPLRRQDPALARPRAVTDPYEPGSTFKPFVWAYAIDLGVVAPDEVLQTPSGTPMVFRDGRSARRIRDVKYYGPSSWRKVLVKSLNTGMAIVSQRMTDAQMQECLRRFGFGTSTACGLAGESAGLVTAPEDWKRLYSQISVSFGQEIGVTAMQMLRAFAVLCGDGTLPTLHLAGRSNWAPPEVVVHPETARLAREVMEHVMIEGTGRRARSERYRIFGKSGTAQLVRADGGGYHEDRYRSSFIGGAPFENPRVAVLCVIDDPDKTAVPDAYGGGALAGPVVRDVIDATLEHLGVPPDRAPSDR